jgi:PKD repeat protein
MKKLFTLLLISFVAFSYSNAQNGKIRCYTVENDARLHAEHPELETKEQFESWMADKIQENSVLRPNGPTVIYNIPVIVHVINNGEAIGTGTNISLAQINSQFDVLNEDYSRTNADAANTPAAFASVAANCEIHFCPAAVDPNGNVLAEPGVHRVNRNTAGFSAAPYTDTYIDGTIKPATSWDPTRYMNIWVCNLGGGLLGYAQFPTGSGLGGLGGGTTTANTDGVVIGHLYYGSINKVNTTQLQQGAPYNLGRTATHEVGHWIGLRHIDGDANCGNDFVSDTPTQQTLNGGCPTFPRVTCSNGPNGEMFMNYMDYTNDACMNTFTAGQKARMVAVMTNSPRRASLNTSTVCSAAAVAPVANFTANQTNICTGQSVIFTNTSTGNPTTYNWTFTGGTPAASTAQNPTVTYATAGTYAVTLTVSNTVGSDVETKTAYISVGGGVTLPITEGFEGTTFVPANWSLGVASPDTFDWKRTTAVSGFGTSTACVYFDNFYGDNSSNPDGTRDELVAPRFSLSGVTNPQMTFDVSYAYITLQGVNYMDTLYVMVSTNCGSTWTTVYNKTGAALQTAPPLIDANTHFVPTATQWRTETINLNAYAGQSNVTVKFVNGSNWGDYIYLDNVNITGTTSSTVTAAFSSNTQSICAGGTVNYTSTSTGNPTTYSWTFPGGTPATSTAQNPTVTYATAGTYNASLTASNGSSTNTSNQTAYITVTAAPLASFTSALNALVATFTNTSTNIAGATYLWNFGDGGTSTLASPSHTYATGGTYTVTLTVTTPCGTNVKTFELTIPNVGIDTKFIGEVKLYPNPTSGVFTFELNDSQANKAELTLYSLHGQAILNRNVSVANGSVKENIETANLASGTYLLKVNAEGRTAHYKVIISK